MQKHIRINISYRRHIILLRKGEKQWLPNSVMKTTLDPTSLMVCIGTEYPVPGQIIDYLHPHYFDTNYIGSLRFVNLILNLIENPEIVSQFSYVNIEPCEGKSFF